MANATSSIEWTDATWGPTTGCDRVSAGCDHCYALTMSKRLKAMGKPHYQRDGDPKTSGPGFGLSMHPDRLIIPFGWRKSKRVFVDSMSDLFHANVTTDFLARVFAVMAANPQHVFQVLTKRPQRMFRFIDNAGTPELVEAAAEELAGEWGWCHLNHPDPLPWPLPNVWLGTSVENHEAAYRIDWLVKTPAAVRFLSCEPLLGPLDLRPWLMAPITEASPYFGVQCHETGCQHAADMHGIYPSGALRLECVQDARYVDWVIAGGESGPGFRPVDPDWVRAIRDQCQGTAAAFFFKQWGGIRSKAGGRELDGRTWDQMPAVAS